MNHVARRIEPLQRKHALTKAFGALLSGKEAPTLFLDWRKCYRTYYDAITHAFDQGNDHVADFDLVSFFELIDHSLLRRILTKHVSNDDTLDLLFKCLASWRRNRRDEPILHGIPQGPEPSAFLAECILFRIDSLRFKDVVYLRYVDDIRLMAKDQVSIRRALVRLDLISKDLGLVPQAQKVVVREVKTVDNIAKIVPSGLLLGVSKSVAQSSTQKKLLKAFRSSLVREGRGWKVGDVTNFRFALHRLKPRRDVLRRIAPLLIKRPDLSWPLSDYLKKFKASKEAADALLSALRQNPVYDSAAMHYVEALDLCEPSTRQAPYRRAVRAARRQSEEKSVLVRLASLTFLGKRAGVKDALEMITKEPEPWVRGLIIHRLFEVQDAPFNLAQSADLLQREICQEDPDLARYAASLLLRGWPAVQSWATMSNVNDAVKILTKALGLRRRGPRKLGIIGSFFSRTLKIDIHFSWRRALGRTWKDAESRCLRLQELDPDARIMVLDTFNEALIQSFSRRHSALSPLFRAAAGGRAHPNYGSWLHNPALQSVLPRRVHWFRWVHKARVGSALAHAEHLKGPKKGLPTEPISRRKADKIMKNAPPAYAELLLAWKKIL